MQTALFINVDSIPFTGYWNGKGRTLKPGEQKYMPDYLARHFAKHLTNKLLCDRHDRAGDNSLSPKFPEQVPLFMEIFNRCYKPGEVEVGDDIDVEIDIANKQHALDEPSANITVQPKKRGRPVKTELSDDLDEVQTIKQGPDDEDFDGLK